MIYNEKQLNTEWIPQIRFQNGQDVNLISFRNALIEETNANGILVSFDDAQVKVGGLFSKQLEDVLVMYNPEHPNDYLRFVVRIQHQGRYAFLHIYNMGGSKNYALINGAQNGSKLSIVRGLVGGVKEKIQIEENYYTILADCISNIAGIQ